ncbi:MAG: RHS repeat-associated core domain-containing protein [Simkaniaceae bacterium]|nr:RHS repeat-associated core domain-containing protein [Simkaniaceae bacterium]
MINHFDSRGFVIKQDIFDGNGAHICTIEKNYDDAGRCVCHIDPSGNQATYTYDANGNLIQEKTSDLITDYTYDIQNNLTSAIRSGKNVSPQKTTFVHNQSGQPILEVDPLGNEAHYFYDHYGRLTQKTTTEQTSDDATWTYSYNLFDHRVTITNPLNNTTAIEYNARGKPTRITSDGKEEAFAYSLEGSLIHHTTPQGITKTFNYDYLGRPTKIRYYERESNENYKTDVYDYDAFHLLSESTSNGKVKYLYNSRGQLIQSIFAQNDSHVCWRKGISEIENGEVTDFSYDSQGRLIETKKWKDTTHYTLYAQKYDPLGHMTEKRIEDEQGKLLYKKQFTYTPAGQLLSEIGFPNNQMTVLTQYTYDPFQRLHQVKKGSSIWDVTYEEDQGLIKKIIKDPLGSSIEESYKRAGLLISRIQKDPKHFLLFHKQFTYDPLNNLIKEKASNFAISYVYNSNASCQSISLTHTAPSFFWKSSEKQEILQHSFAYNSHGELIHHTLPSFEKAIEHTYNAQGDTHRITYQETPNGHIKHYTLTSNKQENTAKIVRDGSFSIEKFYNAHGKILIEKVKDQWGAYEVSYKYDGEGCLTEIRLPDQSTIHYIYEGPFVSKIKRLSKKNEELYTYEATERDLMGNVLQEILPKNLGMRKNSYDCQGRKVEIISDFLSDKMILDPLGNPTQKITKKGQEETKTSFTYDSLSQLIGENDHSYQYDYLQNLVRKDKTSYTIAPYNQVAKAGNCICEYDERGNLKSLSDSSGTMDLQFDALGRLIYTQTSNEETIHYTYDPDLRRMSKAIDSYDYERYFYLGGYELGAIDGQGNIKALRIPINPNAPDTTTVLSIELEQEIYIPFTDLQRNIRCLVDLQKGAIVESYNFSPFGEEEIFTPRRKVVESQLNNPWRFQSKRHDHETGLIYYGARYYHPKLCKWISPDPIGSHDSLNLYLFCYNNPLKYYDPWGLTSEDSQSCRCFHCIKGEGWCHCRGQDLAGDISACICEQRGILSGVAIAFIDTWNNPRFQGGLQAFGGAAEAVIGGGIALGSGGIGASVGGLVMAHGLDQFITGMSMAITGKHRETLTEQLLATTGMPPEWASFTNDMLTIGGTMGGSAIIRASRLRAFSNYKIPGSQKSLKDGVINIKNSRQKVDSAIKAIENFLGGKGKIITNADGDIILMKGNRKVRFDVRRPHGDKPHFHLEQKMPNRKWVDVSSDHRFYFTGD